MHKNRFERSYRDTTPIKGVVTRETNSYRKITESKGKITLTCPICLLTFERYACWAKRYKVQYCGRGCMAEGRKIIVMLQCEHCKKDIESNPTRAKWQRFCDKECSKAFTRANRRIPHNSADYKQVIATINKVCIVCKTEQGPWYIRGIVPISTPPYVSIEQAKIYCKSCGHKDQGKFISNHPEAIQQRYKPGENKR